jgi:hypothetical protein
MVEAGRASNAAEAEEVLMVVAVHVRAEGGREVGPDLREAERHVGRTCGAVEVAGGEAGGRQPRALLGERVAEGPVRDEAVPPASTHAITRLTNQLQLDQAALCARIKRS